MASPEQVEQLVRAAVADLNESLGKEPTVSEDPDRPLIGKGGQLDSVGLVHLIVAIEQRLQDQHQVVITLADERAFSRTASPFRTLAALQDYVAERLREASDG